MNREVHENFYLCSDSSYHQNWQIGRSFYLLKNLFHSSFSLHKVDMDEFLSKKSKIVFVDESFNKYLTELG